MFEMIFTALLLIFILWVLFSHHKTTERKAKAINMSLFSIKSIDQFIQEADLINVFRSMHLEGWNRLLYGDPYISLEKVIKNDVAKYYIAIPKKYEGILTRNPHLSKTDEIILPEDKYYAAIYLHKRHPSIKFSDLKLHEEEGIALQILARHIHPHTVTRTGFSKLIRDLSLFGKGVHDGISHFESNVRVLAWAESPKRAQKVLNLEKVKRRATARLVFDFSLRIFENNRRVKIAFRELKDFLINKFIY
ncbi:MAG: hypothetical protein G01um10142_535 [Parcubacteria group bacterium Gr01-1014_2]|nr:MAG: hypothetical protein G01um10142_535 [Parcubacteria group bacterium Gr01-1014_2]